MLTCQYDFDIINSRKVVINLRVTGLIVVCCFILFDIITGVIKALYEGGLDSSKLRKGLFHKLSEIITMVGCMLLQYAATFIELGFEIPLVNSVCIYICVMELISIIENICEVNDSLRKLFEPYLSKLKSINKDDEKDEI